MQALFTQSFLDALDAHMSCCYDQYTTRTDYLSFLSYLERSMYSHSYEEKGLAYFEHNKLRVFFGQKQIKKVRKWMLDMIIFRLMDKNVIMRTDYDRKRGKTRRYAYHIGFDFDQKLPVFGLKSEEIDQKLTDSITPNVDLSDKDVNVQYQILMSDRFQIDVENALVWIETRYYELGTLSINQKMAYTRMVLDLNAKRIYVIKGQKSGRIFSNFNTIKKELREFCTIDGQALQNLDLKTSQPFIFASLFMKRYPGKESDKFFEIVTEHDIYLWFLSKANERGVYSYRTYDVISNSIITNQLVSRDDSKVAFMRFIFNNSKRGIRPVYESIFKQEFPFLFTKVRLIDNLATELQLQESSIFIPVASGFALRGCLSIHDGLSFKSELRSEIDKDIELSFSNKGFLKYNIQYHI